MKNQRYNKPIADFLFALCDVLESVNANTFIAADIKAASSKLAAWKTAPDEIRQTFNTHIAGSDNPSLHWIYDVIGKSYMELRRPFEVYLSDDVWEWLRWNGYHG